MELKIMAVPLKPQKIDILYWTTKASSFWALEFTFP